MQNFEKLGSFYLGRLLDDGRKQASPELLLYDAKDLTTHALCVGMTGSGKTGLCVGLLEEAAIDGIPAIAVDPKGDLGNLLLTFPELRPADFRPWIDESEALRKGLTPDAYAAKVAETWRNGLAAWGQEPARIARLREAADLAIYTPGSTAGLPLSLLRSFAAPPEDQSRDSDVMRDRVLSTVSGLLALLGIDADPIQSREHILLSNLLAHRWGERRDMEIADVIRGILDPPFSRLGVFDLESFYPQTDRRALAMRLNNVLASPSFAVWMQGDPLDVGRLLYTPQGRPRLSILSIAHLSEAERMFFVTILLNEIVTWMRRQPGTSSLRAVLYMDEIFGYFPPTANPPSKTPMLTLLKQARAFGLGCVLATQNPVDLDYKGLGNTGTWFIGRLQTERDVMRVLDGLEGASGFAGRLFDRSKTTATIAGLRNRVFLMNNVHEDGPVLFETRWALSYLRGPLTRSQIEILMAPRKTADAAPTEAGGASSLPRVPGPGATAAAASGLSEKPVTPPGVRETFLVPATAPPEGARLLYRPGLLASARLHFVSAKAKVDEWASVTLLAPLPEDGTEVLWDEATFFEGRPPEQSGTGLAGAVYAGLPAAAANGKNYAKWGSALADHLYRNRTMTIWSSPELRLISSPGESEGDFRVRVGHAAHEERDLALERLRSRYAPKLAALQERIRKAELRVNREEGQYKQQRMSTIVSLGSTLLGALLGRRTAGVGSMERAATTVNRAGRTLRERDDIQRAQEDVAAAREQWMEMENRFQEEAAGLKARNPSDLAVEQVMVRPRKSDIGVSTLTLAWTPWRVGADGIAEPLFQPS